MLNRELSTSYGAFRKGAAPQLPSLPIQYVDFCHWQRTRLQGGALTKGLAYWTNLRSGDAPHVELPLDHARPPVQTFDGAKHGFQFTPELSGAIRRLARDEGVSVYTVLTAALNALLHRYTGQEDIVIGAPTAGRSRPELEDLIGFFVNTIVLKSDLSGEPTFRELLANTRDGSLAAYAHEEVPFEKVVEALQPTRAPSRNPILQIQLVDQGKLVALPDLAGLEVDRVEFDLGTSMFDLTVFIWDEGDVLAGSVEYNTEHFERATIQRFESHFQNLLEGAARSPETAVSNLPLLGDAERRRLLSEWHEPALELAKGPRKNNSDRPVATVPPAGDELASH